eukprot:Colp12_sorted_trinity150504_noHs@21221
MEEAAKRKARLLAMRQAAMGDQPAQESEPKRQKIDEEKKEDVQIKFRNYTPSDPTFTDKTLAKPDLPALEHEVKDMVESAKEASNFEVDLDTIAPRKPNWDLKRDVEKKLEKLERRTQRAIHELIRRRLQGDKTQLVEAIADHMREEQDAGEESD